MDFLLDSVIENNAVETRKAVYNVDRLANNRRFNDTRGAKGLTGGILMEMRSYALAFAIPAHCAAASCPKIMRIASKCSKRIRSPQSTLADERYGRRMTLEQARRLGPNAARTINVTLAGGDPEHRGKPPMVGREGRGGLSGAAMNSKRAAAAIDAFNIERKTEAQKARSQREYLASGTGWPAI